MSKLIVAVLFGGQSSEHEVSLLSAKTIITNMDRDLYDIVLVGITKDGRWLKVDCLDDIESGNWLQSKITAVLSPDAHHKGVLLMEGNKVTVKQVDVVFPVLHGLYGEDGTVQGLLELSKIPYVGCGVLASAVSMDKLYTKIVVDTLGIRQAKYVPVRKDELNRMEEVLNRVEQALPYPVFVKPSNAGSSKGVSKADNRKQLADSLLLAGEHDRKILVEEAINGREIECAVLGGLEVRASDVGEILAAADASFYDYDAKYNNAQSKTVISPNMPEGKMEEVRQAAVAIFKAVDGYGISRVDFFLENGTNDVVFNEINTLPGFTAISMYPMLWEAKGLSKKIIIDKLIRLALTRNDY